MGDPVEMSTLLSAHLFLSALAARIPAATNLRVVRVDETIAVEFCAAGRVPRYGLSAEDLDRPFVDLVAEIGAHHDAHGSDPVQVPVADIAHTAPVASERDTPSAT